VSGRSAAAAGLRRTARSWGLAVLLLCVNLATAALLAIPLAATLRAELENRPAAQAMMRGVDYPWWSQWRDAHPGWMKTLSPALLGPGFAARNLDLLLKGQLPAALFAVRDTEGGGRPILLDPLLLGAGAAYFVLQVFLAGGVLAVLRQAQGRWTVRAFLHGAGFHFGRFARIAVLMLLAVGLAFALYAPLARWADGMAREAVSERAAFAWTLGRHLLLLAALVFLHLAGTYARVITVVEERTSAVLAVLSGLAFALGHLGSTAAAAAALGALYLAAFALFQLFDGAWHAAGYGTQLVLLLAMQAYVLVRILLRVALQASLMDLYRGRPEA
jgi:hypothetical protein